MYYNFKKIFMLNGLYIIMKVKLIQNKNKKEVLEYIGDDRAKN